MWHPEQLNFRVSYSATQQEVCKNDRSFWKDACYKNDVNEKVQNDFWKHWHQYLPLAILNDNTTYNTSIKNPLSRLQMD